MKFEATMPLTHQDERCAANCLQGTVECERFQPSFRGKRVAVSFAILVASGGAAFGHGTAEAAKPHNYSELWRSWEYDPLVVIGLVVSAFLYTRGLSRLWGATRVGSGVHCWEAGCYAVGWLSIVVALVSPLHTWGRVLFSAHMTQHEVLMLVAAPLLVLGRPLVIFLWSLPSSAARRMARWSKSAAWDRSWRLVSNAFAAFLIHMVALWIWHIPVLFEATIDNNFVHALQHVSFLFSALLFWWAVMHGRQKAIGYGLAVLYLFTTALHSGLLGALLTFTNTVWYPAYRSTTQSWGLSPLEDQQLGGLIMWVPAAVVYIISGIALFAGWMRESEKRVRQREMDFDAKSIAKQVT